MKLTNWQYIAFAAVLLAALVSAYVFAPANASQVLGIVTTLLALLAHRTDGDNKQDPPNLQVLDGGLKLLAIGVIGAVLSACSPTLTPAEQADLQVTGGQIVSCQGQARMCKGDGGSGESCYSVYDACMKDAGLH